MDTFERLSERLNDMGTPTGRNHRRRMRAWRIRHAVLRNTFERIPLVGTVLSSFWEGTIGDDVGGRFFSPMSGVWALQFSHLGDYLFWHKPMTEDYYKGWLSRIPWPRRWHIHMQPCRPFWRSEDGTRHEPNTTCSRRAHDTQ